MARIATSEMIRSSTQIMLDQQRRLADLQRQITSGQRINSAEDDPIGATRVLDLTRTVDTNAQYQKNIEVARSRLSMAEVALVEAQSQLRRVRDLAIQADTETVSNEDREVIAQEIKLLLEGILGTANSKDSNGEFLFSGYQGRTQTFTQTATGQYVYNGDDGQRFLQVGPARQVAVSDTGQRLFGAIKTIQASAAVTNTGTATIKAGAVVDPDSYQPHTFTITFTSSTTYDVTNNITGQTILTNQVYETDSAITFNGSQVTISGIPASGDSFVVSPAADANVFDRIDDLVGYLQSRPRLDSELDQFHRDVNNAINDIDQALNTLSGGQTEIGARVNTLDTQEGINEAFSFQVQKIITGIRDLDYTKAISLFSQQMIALQAAQQAFVRTQSLSLFNFL